MTDAGIESIRNHLNYKDDGYFELKPFIFPGDIIERLKKDPVVWTNYQQFPDYYKNIRIGFIGIARERTEIFEKRLNYFMKMTANNKRFGSLWHVMVILISRK